MGEALDVHWRSTGIYYKHVDLINGKPYWVKEIYSDEATAIYFAHTKEWKIGPLGKVNNTGFRKNQLQSNTKGSECPTGLNWSWYTGSNRGTEAGEVVVKVPHQLLPILQSVIAFHTVH